MAALIVSFFSLHKTNKFNRRQNELADTTERLNRLLIERETADGIASKKADVSARLITVGKNDRRLKVFNRGSGTAKNVRLVDLGEPGKSLLISSDISRHFPVPILEQHQSVELIASNALGSPPRAHVKLLWDDETGNDHEKELTPSF